MRGGPTPKHLFLILLFALSLAGTPHSLPCTLAANGDECQSGTDCCSSLCQVEPPVPNEQQVRTCVECLGHGYAGCRTTIDCCGGNVCQPDGTCNSCTCANKIICSQVVPCSAGADCCSGICSESRCVACIPAGGDSRANPYACCNGLDGTSGVCGGAASTVAGSWFDSSLYIWLGLAVMMAASFLGLAYMAAKLFEIQVLDAWVKVELGELLKSVVIAVFCIALIASANIASQFLAGEGSSANVVANAKDSMRMLYNDANDLYMKLALVYFNVAKVAGYSYTAGTSMLVFVTISYSASPGAGLSPLLAELGQALDAVASYMMLASAQAAFLQFFATASLIMFPVGIFLRSFSFTRRLGGTLLAATIASAVIYPSSVQLSNEVYKTFRGDLQATTANVKVDDAGNPPMTSVVCSELMKFFVQSPIPIIGGENGWHIVVCLPVCAALSIVPGFDFSTCYQFTCKYIIKIIFAIVKAIFPIILYASVFITMDQGTQPGVLLDKYYTPVANYALPAVAKFTVISLFTFLIPIIITLVLLRALASAFGGEAQLYGLSKLV